MASGGGGMGGCNLTKFQLLSLTRRLDSAACRSREMKKAAFRVFVALAGMLTNALIYHGLCY